MRFLANMREEELAGRLSKLQTSLSSAGTKGIQERLQALHTKGGAPLTEGDFNTRLAVLTGGKDNGSTTCAESLKSRLEHLSTTGVRGTTSIDQKYSVPEVRAGQWLPMRAVGGRFSKKKVSPPSRIANQVMTDEYIGVTYPRKTSSPVEFGPMLGSPCTIYPKPKLVLQRENVLAGKT